uniref:Uncharacterized protein n=1 Tax=Pseudictyota dubia TaxID=2749911 RepID=A0A7R9W8Y9_9STRA|mmetsp:Transcript_37243/g.68948  ORF Transcript_37243/g.68948 Transcript_37243/m.68948 type:complete len:258 (+) Transcript_37243:68-841(+)
MTTSRPPRRPSRCRLWAGALLLALSSRESRGMRLEPALVFDNTRVASRERKQESLPTSIPPVDVYLRLSPLVGGPSYLPLHAEIMLLDSSGNVDEEGNCPDAPWRRQRRSGRVLHRFDFLPEEPTDPSTLARLLTLQSVPGLARYRTLPREVIEEVSGEVEEADLLELGNQSIDRILAGGSNGLVLRLFSINPSSDEIFSEYAQISSISSAVRFTEQYQEDRGELNLLSNGCHTFALALISHLNDPSVSKGGDEVNR